MEGVVDVKVTMQIPGPWMLCIGVNASKALKQLIGSLAHAGVTLDEQRRKEVLGDARQLAAFDVSLDDRDGFPEAKGNFRGWSVTPRLLALRFEIFCASTCSERSWYAPKTMTFCGVKQMVFQWHAAGEALDVRVNLSSSNLTVLPASEPTKSNLHSGDVLIVSLPGSAQDYRTLLSGVLYWETLQGTLTPFGEVLISPSQPDANPMHTFTTVTDDIPEL
jgi:hypothetical protein